MDFLSPELLALKPEWANLSPTPNPGPTSQLAPPAAPAPYTPPPAPAPTPTPTPAPVQSSSNFPTAVAPPSPRGGTAYNPAGRETLESGQYWDDALGVWVFPDGNTYNPTTQSWAFTPGTAGGTVAGGPVGAIHSAQSSVYDARQSEINASNQYYDALRGLIPYSQAELDAREQANIKQQAYIAEQLRALEAERAETQAIINAKSNVANIQAAARGQRERDNMAYRFQLAGLPAPVEVKLPPDHQGPLPPGVVARIQTLAEILEDKAKDAQAMRKFNVEAAKLQSEVAQTKVTAAQIASGRVRLDIDIVELAMRQAGLLTDQAELNLLRTKQGPPGMVLDEEANEWVSPSEYRMRQAQRERAVNAALRQQQGGVVTDLSPLSLEGIVSYAALGALGPNWEAMVREELGRRAATEGYTPGFIDIVVNLIRERQAEGESGADTGGPAIPGAGGAGGTGGGSALNSPTLSLDPRYSLGMGYTAPALGSSTTGASQLPYRPF